MQMSAFSPLYNMGYVSVLVLTLLFGPVLGGECVSPGG